MRDLLIVELEHIVGGGPDGNGNVNDNASCNGGNGGSSQNGDGGRGGDGGDCNSNDSDYGG